jgi:hypothetical protein
LRAAAEEHIRRVKTEFEEMESRLVKIRSQIHDKSLDRDNKEALRKQEAIMSERRSKLGAVQIAFETFSPEGLLANAMHGVDALLIWFSIFREWEKMSSRVGHDLITQSMEPSSEVALTWLVVDELPRLFEQHFGRKKGVGRRAFGPSRGEANSPSIRFTDAALRELGATSPRNGKYLKPSGIVSLWKDHRMGVGARI